MSIEGASEPFAEKAARSPLTSLLFPLVQNGDDREETLRRDADAVCAGLLGQQIPSLDPLVDRGTTLSEEFGHLRNREARDLCKKLEHVGFEGLGHGCVMRPNFVGLYQQIAGNL